MKRGAIFISWNTPVGVGRPPLPQLLRKLNLKINISKSKQELYIHTLTHTEPNAIRTLAYTHTKARAPVAAENTHYDVWRSPGAARY
jgi:hypothetical protein